MLSLFTDAVMHIYMFSEFQRSLDFLVELLASCFSFFSGHCLLNAACVDTHQPHPPTSDQISVSRAMTYFILGASHPSNSSTTQGGRPLNPAAPGAARHAAFHMGFISQSEQRSAFTETARRRTEIQLVAD